VQRVVSRLPLHDLGGPSCDRAPRWRSLQCRRLLSQSAGHVHSSALDCPAGDYALAGIFTAPWAREFNAERVPLPTGRFTSSRVRAAHRVMRILIRNLAVMESGRDRDRRRLFGTTLVLFRGISGSARKKGEFGASIAGRGQPVSIFDGRWQPWRNLLPRRKRCTPFSSGEGLGGLRPCVALISSGRACLSRKTLSHCLHDRPYLNTWETAYFE